MNDQVDEQKQKLVEAFGNIRAARERIDRCRGRIRKRAVEQHDSLEEVLGEVSKIRQNDGEDILTHRAHLGLLDEQDRLKEFLGEAHPQGNLRAQNQ